MNELIPMITERDGIPVTTSRAVAECFGKQHAHVIRAIEDTIEQLAESKNGLSHSKTGRAASEFADKNFLPVSLPDAQGKPRPAYLLTRDGFTLLAMGFTGTKALQFKVAYINAFNRMERIINGGGLREIGQRLDALEQRAGIEAPDVSRAVSDSFLQAITDAITGGGYYVRHKYAKRRNDGGAVLLGIQGYGVTAVKALLAYDLYRQRADDPLPRPALWAILERSGAIEPRKKAPAEVFFEGKRQGAIFIDNGLLPR